MPVADDLALLLAAARDAGTIGQRYFRADPKAWDKPDGAGPVTEADLEIDGMLRETLPGARPGYGWLSEESTDHGARLDAAKVFIVDPLDGTRGFIAGSTAWAIALAVADMGEVTAAVIHLPMLDLTYAASKGGGATLNGAPISVSEHEALDGARMLASRTNFEPWHWKEARVPEVRRELRPSLAYRMALVAEGRFDGMLSLRPTWEWDVAAGSLILAEAGGVGTDRRGAAPRFNAPTPQLNGYIGATPRIHAEMVDRLV